MSQTAFASLCGITLQSWNNFETGGYRVGLDSAIAIAKVTGVSLDYIYLGRWACLPYALALEIKKLEHPTASIRT